MSDVFNLRGEVAAAANLNRQLADIQKNDPEFMGAIIEGETNLFEAMEAVDKALAEDEMQVKALEGRIEELTGRKERLRRSAEVKRQLLASALVIAGKKQHRTTESTISLVDIPRKAMVLSEADIPSQYWVQPAPRLDKKALTAALKEGETVPGATLDNGGQTVRVLRK